jgi:hypothetical protein
VLVVHSSAAVRDQALSLGCEERAGERGPSASAAAALAHLGAPALLTTADHPLLCPDWIAAFRAAVPADADVAALLARRDVVEAAVPETCRTWLRFADGDWSGCNLFQLATPGAAAALALWQEVERDRKRPWRIVRRLGPGLLVRYLLGRLTLAEAITRIGRLAGVRAAMVPSPCGLAAVDVDKPADLDLVRRLLNQGLLQQS